MHTSEPPARRPIRSSRASDILAKPGSRHRGRRQRNGRQRKLTLLAPDQRRRSQNVNAGLITDTDRSCRRLPRCDEAKWALVPRERATSGAALPVRPRPSGAPALPARERVRALRVSWLDSARPL
jgi:hypothetical protein